MPKSTETIRDGQNRPTGTRVVGQDEDVLVAGEKGTTAGKGLGAKGAGGAGMPSMKDYPNDLAGFQAAMRKYRESQRATDPVKSAVGKMLGETAGSGPTPLPKK